MKLNKTTIIGLSLLILFITCVSAATFYVGLESKEIDIDLKDRIDVKVIEKNVTIEKLVMDSFIDKESEEYINELQDELQMKMYQIFETQDITKIKSAISELDTILNQKDIVEEPIEVVK